MAGKNSKSFANRAPVSRHPAFPAVVALWFAALLGIGSLVLPARLFDDLAGVLGMDSLGLGARIAIAIVAGAAGAVLGLVLARKVLSDTQDDAPDAPRTREVRDGEAKRPIWALEELGPEGLDEPLSQDEEDSSRAEPVPGPENVFEVADEDAASADSEPDGEDDALELGDFADGSDNIVAPDDTSPDPDRFFGPANAEEPDPYAFGPREPEPDEDVPTVEADPEPVETEADEPPFLVRQRDNDAPIPETGDQSVKEDAAEPDEAPADLPFGMPQPVDEAEADQARPRHPLAAPGWFGDPEVESETTESEVTSSDDPDPARRGVAEKPLAELGMVELVERFALSLQRHGQESAEPPVESGARTFGMPEPVEQSEANDEDEREDFGSLLAMKRSRATARKGAGFADNDAAAAVFPSHQGRRATPAADGPSRDAGGPAGRAFAKASPDPASTEAALRDALARLQKLSGAA